MNQHATVAKLYLYLDMVYYKIVCPYSIRLRLAMPVVYACMSVHVRTVHTCVCVYIYGYNTLSLVTCDLVAAIAII